MILGRARPSEPLPGHRCSAGPYPRRRRRYTYIYVHILYYIIHIIYYIISYIIYIYNMYSNILQIDGNIAAPLALILAAVDGILSNSSVLDVTPSKRLLCVHIYVRILQLIYEFP